MNGQLTISSQIPDNLLSNRLTLDAMKLLRHIITSVCLVATFVANAGEQLTTKAKCVVTQPINAELQLLQGTWEGFSLSREKPDGPPVKGTNTITVTVTGNSLHFHRDTNFWWKTTITLPADTNPRQLHATIKDCHDCPPQQENSAGTVVVAIFKIEDGTLTLATGNGDGEAPKSFEAAPNRYELRKVQPQKKMSGSGLGSLVLEGHELHASLKTRQMDDSVRHVPRAPGNPHVSTNADFVATIAKGASQGRLGREGVRSVLYALYLGKKELGFYGLEAESSADANRLEDTIRKIWSNNVRMGRAQVHRKGLVLVVVWTDGVSRECWEAVNAKVVERLVAP